MMIVVVTWELLYCIKFECGLLLNLLLVILFLASYARSEEEDVLPLTAA
jgi:hypothetical protein